MKAKNQFNIHRITFVFLGLLLTSLVAFAQTPVSYETQKLISTDSSAVINFGISIDMDDGSAIIGAVSSSPNSAYVFTRDSAGYWSQQAALPGLGSYSGWSVAIDQDTAIVGTIHPFSAQVFHRDSADAWSLQQTLLPWDALSRNDWYGWAVDVEGDIAVVGAQGADTAYVYVRDETGIWSGHSKLQALGSGERFGVSIAIEGDNIVIGAESTNSAYIFARDTLDNWYLEAIIKPDGGLSDGAFGYSVAIDQQTVVVGAHRDDGGRAYIYGRDGSGTWLQQAKLSASDGVGSDYFGGSVDIEAGTVLIGARGDDDNGSESGSAYLFTRGQQGTWDEHLKLLASDGAVSDQLGGNHRVGHGVAIDGGVAMAAAYKHDVGPATNQGAVYSFDVNVDDEGPHTSGVSVSPNPVAVNSPFTISATIDDTLTGGSAIAGAKYTLNQSAPITMAATDGAFDSKVEEVSALLSLPTAGVYDTCVAGEDIAGNIGVEECSLLAVYDSSAGFVTGGGWIQSPPGAYASNHGLSGKANFGFVSKYLKGQSSPTGEAQFQFRMADLAFHSTSYDWLVISGAKAQFKGTGAINGSGNYGFKLVALDADLTPSDSVDRFRIKIWDRDNGDLIVYDNEIESQDDITPTTEIGGGAISIHDGN